MTCFDIAPDGTVTDHLPELWEDIPGYENFYQISNHGRVRSMARFIRADVHGTCTIKARIGKVLRSNPGGSGYPMVTLCRDGVHVGFHIARMVAFIWVDGYEPGMVVGHFDGDKMNCRADNLYWMKPGRNRRGRWVYGV